MQEYYSITSFIIVLLLSIGVASLIVPKSCKQVLLLKKGVPYLVIILVLRSFVFDLFIIPSGSMIPLLEIKDFIVVNKLAYGVRHPYSFSTLIPISSPNHGDVVTFFKPEDQTFYVKRIIGKPLDLVSCSNKNLQVNNVALNTSFIKDEGLNFELYYEQPYSSNYSYIVRHKKETLVPPSCKPISLKKDQYFVSGDNREESTDSRTWGAVSEDHIFGKVVLIFKIFPFHIKFL